MKQLEPRLEVVLKGTFDSDVRNKIQQNEWEIREFLFKVQSELKPRLTVELGSWRGRTALLLSMVTSGHTISLDIEDYGRKEEAYAIAKANGCDLLFLMHNARLPETVQAVLALLSGPIDLLFIDDGHCIEEVTEEYAVWRDAVRPGGWIAFHDINPEANQCAPGVHPSICQAHVFWAGLAGNKEEIICKDIAASPGIGILRT